MVLDYHFGVVMTNDKDGEKEFGVELQVDTLLPAEVYPGIWYPIFPPNMAKAPGVGQLIECFVIADETGMDPGEGEIGTIAYGEYLYYTGRIFDLKNGKIPAELKINYPKRSGIFWAADGTIIYYDETKDKNGVSKKELMISLTDKKNYIFLKEDEIYIQQDDIKIQLKDGKVVITNQATEMGAAGAAESILLGDIVYNAISNLVTPWLAAATALGGAPDPTGASAQAYGVAMQGALNAFQPTLANWRSTKHKVDS